MSQRTFTRRSLLLSIGGAASALMAACGGAASPTAVPGPTGPGSPAPAKPTEAPKPAGPTAAASPAGGASPGATAPAAAKPPGTTGPVKLSDGKLVLGVINDQSGVYADISGKNGVKAVEMAIADFKAKYGDNALGGPIEVISADHQNKPDLANSKAQEFYDRDQCDLILDVPTSSCALAVAKVAGEKKKLYINIGAATTELTGPSCNRYTYHYAYDTYMLAQGTGAEVTKTVGKNWYIIYPNYAFGQDMDRSFRAAIEANGGKVIASDPTPFPSNGDFSTFLLKAASAKPDVIGTMHAGQEVINMVKQYNEFKLRDQKINLAIGLLFDTDIHALGPDPYAGILYTTAWNWNLDEQSRQWADKFQKAVGIRPTFAHAGDYSGTFQYLEAVMRAGTDDPDAVVKALDGYKFGDFMMRNAFIRAEDHQVIHDAYLGQVKPKSDVTEDWDYTKILRTIPAEQAFRSASDAAKAGCKM
jgi:branched-chain amino acid transport system substrate-binding protein